MLNGITPSLRSLEDVPNDQLIATPVEYVREGPLRSTPSHHSLVRPTGIERRIGTNSARICTVLAAVFQAQMMAFV